MKYKYSGIYLNILWWWVCFLNKILKFSFFPLNLTLKYMVLASWFEFRRNKVWFNYYGLLLKFICQNFSSIYLSQAWHYSYRLYWHEVPTRGFKLHFQWGCSTLWIFCSIRQWTKSLSANTPWGEHSSKWFFKNVFVWNQVSV